MKKEVVKERRIIQKMKETMNENQQPWKNDESNQIRWKKVIKEIKLNINEIVLK